MAHNDCFDVLYFKSWFHTGCLQYLYYEYVCNILKTIHGSRHGCEAVQDGDYCICIEHAIGGAPSSLVPPGTAPCLPTVPARLQSRQASEEDLMRCFHQCSWKASRSRPCTSSTTSCAVSPAMETTRRTCAIAWPSWASACVVSTTCGATTAYHGHWSCTSTQLVFARPWRTAARRGC